MRAKSIDSFKSLTTFPAVLFRPTLACKREVDGIDGGRESVEHLLGDMKMKRAQWAPSDNETTRAHLLKPQTLRSAFVLPSTTKSPLSYGWLTPGQPFTRETPTFQRLPFFHSYQATRLAFSSPALTSPGKPNDIHTIL